MINHFFALSKNSMQIVSAVLVSKSVTLFVIKPSLI